MEASLSLISENIPDGKFRGTVNPSELATVIHSYLQDRISLGFKMLKTMLI